MCRVLGFGKMRTIATVPCDTVTNPGLRTQVDSTQKTGGEHLQPTFGCKEQRKTLTNKAPPDVDFYAAISSSHLMPNAIDLSDEIQGMMSHAAMMSKRAKLNSKLSAYDPDPMSLDACKKSDNWEYPKQGNSWKQAIMN